LEVGGWRLEVGGWRLEVGGWRLEVGGWKLEVGGFFSSPRPSPKERVTGRERFVDVEGGRWLGFLIV